MRIAFDASSAARPEATGVAVYIRRLLSAMAEAAHGHELFVCYRLSRLKARRHFFVPRAPNVRLKIIQEPFNLLFPRTLDVFHGLDARIPRYSHPKLVVTVHDIFSALPGSGFATDAFKEMKTRRYEELSRRADCVVTISGAVRSQIVEHLGIPAERVRVVYEAPGEEFRPQPPDAVAAVRKALNIERPYLLYVGSINRRKNVRRMVEAFGIAWEKTGRRSDFVIAGRCGFGAEEATEAISKSPARESIRVLGYVEDGHLPALYSGANGLAFPTLYEGFGLPVVEAFACGCPVLVSNSGSLPEVAGGAALVADAQDTEGIAECMRRLIAEDSVRSDLREKGTARAQQFSWKESARQLLEVYHEMVAH